MWQWTPTKFTDFDLRARSAALCASPLPKLKPNFESFWPVAMYSCVCTETPGVIRNCTRGAGKPSACNASKRSSSSKLSTTMWCTSALMAIRNSSMLLLLPCITQLLPGTPALRATNSSPPVATSSIRPSSYANFAIAVQKKALVA